MKKILTIGLLSLLSVSCIPQYWGEGTYELENVKFGIDVDKYYSKAVDIKKKKWKSSEKFDHSMRYYSKDTIECITTDGRKDTIYEYSSFETTYSDVLARFENFKFPYIGMVADKNGGMIGIIACGSLKDAAEVNSLLLSLAAKYGSTCLYSESLHGETNYAWHIDDRTIQLWSKNVDETVRNAFYYEEDEKGNRKFVGSGKRLDTSREVSLFVTKTQYDPFLEQISMGKWIDFHCFDAESDSIYLEGTEKLITELDLVLDKATNYLTIPNGSMPRFPPNAYSDHPDFTYMIYNWLENHAPDGVEETAHGDCDVSFTIDKNGKVKDIKVEKVHFGASGDLKTAAINAIKRLPQFIPATQNGKPVSFRITTSISF